MDYNDNDLRIWESLWIYCKDETNDNKTDSESFKFKYKFTNDTTAAGSSDFKIAIPFIHLEKSSNVQKQWWN